MLAAHLISQVHTYIGVTLSTMITAYHLLKVPTYTYNYEVFHLLTDNTYKYTSVYNCFRIRIGIPQFTTAYVYVYEYHSLQVLSYSYT